MLALPSSVSLRPGGRGGSVLFPALAPEVGKMGQGLAWGGVPEEVAMDVAPPALDSARAVLPNNILVLSDGTRNSSISDFVEEGSCQPPDARRARPTPRHPFPHFYSQPVWGLG